MPSTIRGSDNFDSKVIGQEQSWSDVTGSRAAATLYANTTGRPIMVSIGCTLNGVVTLTVGGVVAAYAQPWSGSSIITSISVIVPAGDTYIVSTCTINSWSELS